ncbi:hypothetical protein F4801DRAFT_605672 [Xylaria longipes]|nr:hypothetical protein F4801DRAFT_605672 [Xylaria longipes]RYC63280.1 hypothetical protein CHU98_g2910 [Xylaria longipes]
MPLSITQLPNTVLVDVLKQVNNIYDLSHALLAHKCFKNAFNSYPGIAEALIPRHIHPQLLPLAIANIEASHTTYTPSDIDTVKDLYWDVFENPTRFTDRLKVPNTTNPIPIKDLIQMVRINDVIGQIARKYILEAWEGIMRAKAENEPSWLTRTEWLRLHRAFYRLELFFKLCRGDGANGLQPRDIGLSDEDPLARSDMRPRWIDIWISQGIEFWLLVEEAGSREDRLALLASVIKRKYVFFEEMYLVSFSDCRHLSPWFESHQGRIEFELPDTPYDDQDEGPPTIWITCHHAGGQGSTMVDFESTSEVTKLAYLF